MRRFFELQDDLARRWFLTSPKTVSGQEVDPRRFTQGAVLDAQPELHCGVDAPGKVVDFTFGPFDFPIVNERILSVFRELASADVQAFPIQVNGALHYVLNVVRLIPCLDTQRSDITWWQAEDGRPDRTGKPRMVTTQVIDSRAVPAQARVFRIEGWKTGIIVDELVATELARRSVTGIFLREQEVS